ncbi:MAG: twin-arginine translocase subunit TatC [Pseudomonadota bacterium]
MLDDEKIPLTDHLDELRKRLITCFIAVGVGFAVSYGFSGKLFDILTHPLVSVMKSGDKIIFTGVTEAFFTYMKVALIAGIGLSSPVIVYQFWMFVAPGLHEKERRLVIPVVLLSTVFFSGGALFGYFIVFPVGFKYLMSFGTETIRPMPSMREYLGFASTMLLSFGFVFELPILITFMARLGVVTVDFLKKNRKYAILLNFVIAAILTPSPDAVSQILMAGPLMLLYEISIIGAKIFGKKPAAPDADTGEEAQDSAEETEGANGSGYPSFTNIK